MWRHSLFTLWELYLRYCPRSEYITNTYKLQKSETELFVRWALKFGLHVFQHWLCHWFVTRTWNARSSAKAELVIAYIHMTYNTKKMIGVSLSEPHTSMTALHTCVCMFACLLACLDQPLTVKFKRAHSNISRTSISLSMWRPVEAWLSECSIGDPEWRQLKLKHMWQLNSSDLCLYQQRQAAHRRYRNMDGSWLLGSLQVGPCIAKWYS